MCTGTAFQGFCGEKIVQALTGEAVSGTVCNRNDTNVVLAANSMQACDMPAA